jgi:hypothetical protein
MRCLRILITLTAIFTCSSIRAFEMTPESQLVRLETDTWVALEQNANQLIRLSAMKCPPNQKAFDASVNTITQVIDGRLRLARSSLNNQNSSQADWHFSSRNQSLSFLLKMLFKVADEALVNKCSIVADKYYRLIVTVFKEPKYAADRQRAQIGIDDARAIRSSSSR